MSTPKAPYPTITPYIITRESNKVAAFLKEVFEAREVHMMLHDNGTIRHATLQIRESMVMLSEATEAFPAMPTMCYVYLEEVDSYFQKALAAGATPVREPRNEDFGDRNAGVQDLAGNLWWIAGPLA